MVIDYSQILKSIDDKKVLIKNKVEVNEKIQKLIKGGYDNLQIISDYDKTITKQHVNGKPQLHAYSIFSKCPSVPPSIKKIISELNQKYVPLDKDLSIPESERKKLMEEWWNKVIDVYKGLNISQEEIENTTLSIGPPARDNSNIFFNILSEANVPVLLISAGIGDCLEPLLKQMGINNTNIEMLANYIQRDDEGRILGYKRYPPIHSTNKYDIDFNNTNFYQKVRNRHNAILMGDHLGDATMANNLETLENSLKIGFFYGEVESVLPTWLETFDIVLKDDQTMNVPIAILKLLKGK